MDVFESDYSNLFAAGLRGIQSRSTDPDPSSPKSQLYPAIASSIDTGSADHNQDVKRIKGPGIPSSFWKSFHLSTRLWRRPARLPRSEKISSVVRGLTARTDAESRSTRRQSIPSDVVEEASLKVRILDWSLHVSNAIATVDEEECIDPCSFDEVDPVDVPASSPTKILLTLPTSASLEEQEISPVLEQHDRRMSLHQALSMHKMLPTLPYRSFFSSDDEITWESASASTSDDEPGLDDDWHQFRVEWIDFDGSH